MKATSESAEWIFLATSLGLEMLSAACDQASSLRRPHYALFGVLLATAAVLISIWELIYRGKKERVVLMRRGMLWWFYYPPPRHTPYGTLPDIFGLVAGISQCICSIVQYVYCLRHADNPFKASLLPAIFLVCLGGSKLSNSRMNANTSSTEETLLPAIPKYYSPVEKQFLDDHEVEGNIEEQRRHEQHEQRQKQRRQRLQELWLQRLQEQHEQRQEQLLREQRRQRLQELWLQLLQKQQWLQRRQRRQGRLQQLQRLLEQHEQPLLHQQHKQPLPHKQHKQPLLQEQQKKFLRQRRVVKAEADSSSMSSMSSHCYSKSSKSSIDPKGIATASNSYMVTATLVTQQPNKVNQGCQMPDLGSSKFLLSLCVPCFAFAPLLDLPFSSVGWLASDFCRDQCVV